MVFAMGMASSAFAANLHARPALGSEVQQLLLAVRTDKADYQKGCLDVSQALVAQNDGIKKKVGSQLHLICAGLQLPLDADMCQRYHSTLMGHLHDGDASFNLQAMDYSLLCKGMKKVKAEQTNELKVFKKEKMAYNKKLKAAVSAIKKDEKGEEGGKKAEKEGKKGKSLLSMKTSNAPEVSDDDDVADFEAANDLGEASAEAVESAGGDDEDLPMDGDDAPPPPVQTFEQAEKEAEADTADEHYEDSPPVQYPYGDAKPPAGDDAPPPPPRTSEQTLKGAEADTASEAFVQLRR